MPQGSRRRTLELEAGTPGHHPCTSLPFTGTYVTRAEATDADDPETDNAALRYSILEQGGPQLFSIDPLTGEIRTVQVGLDRGLPVRWPQWSQAPECLGLVSPAWLSYLLL